MQFAAQSKSVERRRRRATGLKRANSSPCPPGRQRNRVRTLRGGPFRFALLLIAVTLIADTLIADKLIADKLIAKVVKFLALSEATIAAK